MPAHYWYHCDRCDYRAVRYRNVRRCPDCGGNLVREDTPRAENRDGLPQPSGQTTSAR